MEQIRLFGIDIVNGTTPETLTYFSEVLEKVDSPPVFIAFINAHGINLLHENGDYRQALSDVDWILNDGVGLEIAAKLQGLSFQENLNGTDLLPRVVARCAESGARLFVLGTTAPRLEKALSNLSARHPALQIAGSRDGFFDNESSGDVIREINDARADVLLVALGNPKQEIWVAEHRGELNVKLIFAVGAYIDFESGDIVRAPTIIQAIRLEWLFRLLQEPCRLWNRYLVGNMKFLWRAVFRSVP